MLLHVVLALFFFSSSFLAARQDRNWDAVTATLSPVKLKNSIPRQLTSSQCLSLVNWLNRFLSSVLLWCQNAPNMYSHGPFLNANKYSLANGSMTAPAVRAAVKTEMSHRNDTIMVFFFAANKNEDNFRVASASSRSTLSIIFKFICISMN